MTQDAGHQQVLLGTADASLRDWIRRLLAPETVLSTAASDTRNWPARAVVRFRAAPSGLDVAPTPTASLLDSVGAVVSPGSWTLDIVGQPAGPGEVQQTLLELYDLLRDTSAMLHTTVNVDDDTSVQRADPAAERVADWLRFLAGRVSDMRGSGAWSVTVVCSASDHGVLAHLLSSVCAAGPVPADARPQIWLADTFPVAGHVPVGSSTRTFDGAAPGRVVGSVNSVVNAAELAAWLRPPLASRGGVDVGPPFPTDRQSLPAEREVWIGDWLGTAERAAVDLNDLEGHAFVAGVTGSGKSTTVERILLSAWNRHDVPFLVIDPVKDDYDNLAGLVRDGLTHVRGRDLRCNVLSPTAGFDVSTHIDYICAAFKGSFSMPSPVPYVVTLLFDQVREDALAGRRVSLHDLRRAMAPLVAELGYRGELEANVLASLGVRLAVLCAPRRAPRICTDVDLSALFERPTVVTLNDIGDDEERAFVTAALTIAVTEYARARGRVAGVRHLTVLEEAHRVVGEPGQSSDETGNAAGHTARLVTQLLAEIRAFGESLLILDQSPSVVARDVLRNTNSKIIHRTLDEADRRLLAGAVGIPGDDSEFLAQLRPGIAMLSTRRLPRPQMVQVGAPIVAGSAAEPATAAAPPARPCCGSDELLHQRAEAVADEAGALVSAALAGALVRDDAAARGVRVSTALALHQLAVRHTPPAAVACLTRAGARVAAYGWLREEWIGAGDVDALTDTIVRLLAPEATGLTRANLPRVALAGVRPYDGCGSCAHACLVRPVGRSMPGLAELRDAVRGLGGDRRGAVTAQWRQRAEQRLAATLGAAAARDAARCAALHALDDDLGTADNGEDHAADRGADRTTQRASA